MEKRQNLSIMIYVIKINNSTTFKIKTGTKKLVGSTKSNNTKGKNCENVPHLEIIEVALIHCYFVKKQLSSKTQECCIYLFLINHLITYLIFHPNIFYF